jgi:hypothetical protein
MTRGLAVDAPISTPPAIELAGLFDIVRNLDDYAWEPFRDGVDIFRIYGDGVSGPAAALS